MPWRHCSSKERDETSRPADSDVQVTSVSTLRMSPEPPRGILIHTGRRIRWGDGHYWQPSRQGIPLLYLMPRRRPGRSAPG